MTRLLSKDAATYIGYAQSTLKKSRTDGTLGGVPTPVYIKIGRRVFYEQSELDGWLEQFKPRRNTAGGAA
jgi:predicted DNA-binding transcriptional regulator AlpA